MNREDWLRAAIVEMAPLIQTMTGHAVPAAVRVSCALPSTFTRSGTLGEYWPPKASADEHHEIMVSPTLADPAEVLPVLLHEVLHAAVAPTHTAAYAQACTDLGLEPHGPDTDPWNRTRPGKYFQATWAPVLAMMGEYPHAPLLAGVNKVKQGTRMLKCVCPSCGWTFRATTKWVDKGLPTCACGDVFAAETTQNNLEI
jgi:hypothetical protein